MIAAHAALIPKLMQKVKGAISGVQSNTDNNVTHVIVSTVGMTFIPRVDICINQFNNIVTDAAHAEGFPVFERAEIERRLMRKSIGRNKPLLPNDVHLDKPGPAISSTALLAMISCLEDDRNKKRIENSTYPDAVSNTV